MRARFSEAQILGFLREAAAGTPVMDLCWNHCFSRSTFHTWKRKYGAAARKHFVSRDVPSTGSGLAKSIQSTYA